MKKSKGFTLIELLAVIIVLAVIALIAVPIILNVIEKAKQGAAVSSALGIVDAVEKQITLNKVNSSNREFELPITEGNLRGIVSAYNVQIKNFGKNDSGTINIDKKGIISKAMFSINGYYICYTPKGHTVSKKGETTDFGECNGMSVPDIVTAYQVSYTNEEWPDVEPTVGDNIDNLYKIFSEGEL